MPLGYYALASLTPLARTTGLATLWVQVLKGLLDQASLQPHTISLDGVLIPSFAFQEVASYSGKHRHTGTKLSIAVESQGIPLSLQVAAGSAHDLPLAIPTVEAIPSFLRHQIQELLADTAYDAASFRTYLREHQVASHVPKRSWPHPHHPRPPHASRRFVVERTNAWSKSFRRLRFRYDYPLASFMGLVTLAVVVICVRKLTL